MPSNTTPEPFLTQASHAPARGSAVTAPLNSPTPTSSAANAGAPHGAATIPDVAPSRNTAGYDAPPSPEAHCTTRDGTATGITSSMASAKTSSRFPIPRRAQGLPLTVPNSDPVSQAPSPRPA